MTTHPKAKAKEITNVAKRSDPALRSEINRSRTSLRFITRLRALHRTLFNNSSVRSSSVHHGLIEIQRSSSHFSIFQIWSNPAYIHSKFTFTFIQCSIYRTEPGNILACITLTTSLSQNSVLSSNPLVLSTRLVNW